LQPPQPPAPSPPLWLVVSKSKARQIQGGGFIKSCRPLPCQNQNNKKKINVSCSFLSRASPAEPAAAWGAAPPPPAPSPISLQTNPGQNCPVPRPLPTPAPRAPLAMLGWTQRGRSSTAPGHDPAFTSSNGAGASPGVPGQPRALRTPSYAPTACWIRGKGRRDPASRSGDNRRLLAGSSHFSHNGRWLSEQT